LSKRGHDDIWSLVAGEPRRSTDREDVGGWLERLCRTAAQTLPAAGLGVSLMSATGEPAVMAASSPDSEVLEELQFTLGEGPCQDAYKTGRPVLAPDVRKAETQWPGYVPAVVDLGVEAVFAFPLQLGSARLGALDIYREHAGSLSDESFEHALAFASVATESLLDAQERSASRGDAPAGLASDRSYVVYQAQGMVQVQLGIDLAEAMVRLRARAYAEGRPVSEVARDIVARRLVLESDA
jgi:GAF domain/ANTAR domain